MLQQHSCMTDHGKLGQKEYGCSGSKSAEELGKMFVAGEKPLDAYTVPKLLQAVQGFLQKQGTTDPCPEDAACSFY